MKCTQRLYLTKDRKALVPAGHKNAATLYAVPGDEIPQSAADRFKLVDGALKGHGAKEADAGQDKERKGGNDKGGNGQGDQGRGAPQPDDFAALKGVGAKTAAALVAAGYTSFASIAAIDPANPPTIAGMPAVFKWAEVVAEAKAKAPAETVEQAGASGGAGA